jgi:LysM repeat protein
MTKFLTIIFLGISFLIFSLVSPQSSFAFSGNGSGTNSDPYQISTCVHLQEMNNALSASYKQINDIDCFGISFTPIGDTTTQFSGSLNGQNYAISNLVIPSSSYAGLIGYTDAATIQNVRIISGTVTGTSITGGIVARTGANTTISHCSSQVTLNGTGSIGGIGGITIENSFYNGTLNSTGGYTGGIVGNIYGGTNTIRNTYSSGTLTLNTSAYFGGIAGAMNDSTTISNSYTNATMVTTGSNYSGGLVGGFFAGTVTNSFSAATITGSGSNVGAVFGRGEGTASGLYADVYLAGTSTCSASGSASCTAKNSGNSDPSYFKGNSTSLPMSGWNFSTIWQTVSANYPSLIGFNSPIYREPLNSNSPSQCPDSAPRSSPNLFQINSQKNSATLYFSPIDGPNTGYVISYGLDNNAQGYAVSFPYSSSPGVISYTINSLFPANWHFKIRGQNGCMPGVWSNVVSAQNSIFIRKPVSTNTSQTILGISSTKENSCLDYAVKSGDTLWQIASQNLGSGSRFSKIMEENNLTSTNLKIGQKIKVGCN